MTESGRSPSGLENRGADTASGPADTPQLISYAQNHEDILLWRAFRDIPRGFYVDVGANSPADSLTALFYSNGWRGINVEPVTSWFRLIEAARPRDINLNICISDSDEDVEMTEVVDTGLSTADPDVALRYEGRWETRPIRRPARRLADVLAEHAPDEIHFLSVDVEGMEHAVLAGADFAAHRPRVIIVESVRPDTHEPSHEDWEPILHAAGYELLVFDGVNRFYAASEHAADLAPHFRVPPNSTDNFIPRVERDATRLASERGDALHEVTLLQKATHEELTETHRRLRDEMLRNGELTAQLDGLDAALAQMRRSASWRLTAPLRTVAARLRQIRNGRRGA